MPNTTANPGDIIDDIDFEAIEDQLNTERDRRGDPHVDVITTDNGGRTESIDYNTLANGYNSMTGIMPDTYPSVPTKPVGEIIKAADLNILIDAITDASHVCLCDCNYCTCDCNYCTCDCNYCTCDCNYCTCDCNYSCTCNCNYSDKSVKENIVYL